MALKTRVWGAGKLLLLGGALLLTYFLFAAAAMRVALRTREVVVPSLTGRTVSEATAIVADFGLNLKVEETRRADPKLAAGQILMQEPQAGLRTRRERSVKVWVSAGPRAMRVAAFAGESPRAAQIRLQQDGIELVSMSEVRSRDYPSETVIAQTPAPNSTASAVSLLVNHGERGATYVMPDLIGVNGDRAADLLRVRGFRVAVVGDHPYPGVPAGIVLRQHPQGGFQIAPGEPISIEVSR